MPSLESRAEECANIAKEALLRPSTAQVSTEYTEPIGGNLVLKLYSSGFYIRTPGVSETGPATDNIFRNIYIAPADAVFGTTLFGLNMMSITEDSAPAAEAETETAEKLLQECKATTENGNAIARLALTSALRALEQAEVAELKRLFMLASELGHVTSTSSREFLLSNDRTVGLRSHNDSSGNYKSAIDGPPLKIEVRGQGQWLHSVLQQLPNNTYETFEEIADTQQRLTANANEADIAINEDGVQWGLFIRDETESVLAEAERAMGLRDLNVAILSGIEDAMYEVKESITEEDS